MTVQYQYMFSRLSNLNGTDILVIEYPFTFTDAKDLIMKMKAKGKEVAEILLGESGTFKGVQPICYKPVVPES